MNLYIRFKFMFWTMGVRLIPNLGLTLWRDISKRAKELALREEKPEEEQDEPEMVLLSF